MAFNYVDLSAFLVRFTLGLFFVLARFRFFYDPSQPYYRFLCPTRIKSLTNKMAHCGFRCFPVQLAFFVAAWEVLAGIALIVGLLTELAAFGMLVVLLVATRCTCRQKVEAQHPCDRIDAVACYLWTPEPLYVLLTVLVLLLGPGAYSLDAVLWR